MTLNILKKFKEGNGNEENGIEIGKEMIKYKNKCKLALISTCMVILFSMYITTSTTTTLGSYIFFWQKKKTNYHFFQKKRKKKKKSEICTLWDVTDRDIDKVTLKILEKLKEEEKVLEIGREIIDAKNQCKLALLNGAAICIYGLLSFQLVW